MSNSYNYSHRSGEHENNQEEWTISYDENGNEYYYNNDTGESSWTKPTTLDSEWTTSYDENGNEYYVNNITGESRWTLPNSVQEVKNLGTGSNIFQRIAKKMGNN